MAVRCVRAAADRNLPMAQLTLGMKYATGEGLPRNLEAAVGWMERAAESGSMEAKLQLRKYKVLLERSKKAVSSVKLEMDNRTLSQIAASKTQATND